PGSGTSVRCPSARTADRAAMVFVLGLAWVCGLGAQAVTPGELEVKSAYLFSFGRFVQWPARPGREGADFDICVLGADPFGATLDTTIAGGTIRGRKVSAR